MIYSLINKEKFFREVAKENYKFLKSKPLCFNSSDSKKRQVAWLRFMGLMETWYDIYTSR